jgi:hypothetical protein
LIIGDVGCYEAGESFLRENNIPVVTREQDASYLKKHGLNVEANLKYWQPVELLGGKITAIPALHGHSWVHNLMANGAGFYLQLPDFVIPTSDPCGA